jgi:hypothetical protein
MPKVKINEVEWYPVYVVSQDEEYGLEVELTPEEMKLVNSWEKLHDAVWELLRRKYEEQEEKIEKKSDIKLFPSKGQT